MTHQYVESFSDYKAVLLRSDDEPGKEDRWITRCFMTCGFTEHENGDEMVFVHIESKVLIACDGDALAIHPVDDPKALKLAYSDLFMVMKNMDWKRAEVYTMDDVDELINDMAAFVPASYDLSLDPGSAGGQESVVESLREDIAAQHAARQAGLSSPPEPTLKMADILPGNAGLMAPEPAPQVPLHAPQPGRAATEPSVAVPAAPGGDQISDLLAALVRGQNAMQTQFTGLMTTLVQTIKEGQTSVRWEGPDVAAGIPASAAYEPASELRQSQVAAALPVQNQQMIKAAELVAASPAAAATPTPATSMARTDLISGVGRIPAPPIDDGEVSASGVTIGRIPGYADSDSSELIESGFLEGPAQVEGANLDFPTDLGGHDPGVSHARDYDATGSSAQDALTILDTAVGRSQSLLMPEQLQLIDSLTRGMQAALREVFAIRNQLDLLLDSGLAGKQSRA
jgi:hypothetical protein